MVDENADRSYAPGQQPVPERDIEPLWPAAQAEGAPSWAPPGVPGQPPPSAGPGVSGGAQAPGGWAMIGPPGAARPWTPDTNDDPTGASPDGGASSGWAPPGTATTWSSGWAPGGDPARWGGQTPPPPPPPSTTQPGTYPSGGGFPAPDAGAWSGRAVPHPAPDAGAASGGTAAAPGGQVPVSGAAAVPAPRPGQPAGVDLDLPFSLDPAGPGGPGTGAPGSAEARGGTSAHAEEGSAVPGATAAGRAGESPWAQPPQRPAPTEPPGHSGTASPAEPSRPDAGATPPAPAWTPPAEAGTPTAAWGDDAGAQPVEAGTPAAAWGNDSAPPAPAWAAPAEAVPAATPPEAGSPGEAAAVPPPPGPFPPQPGWYPPPWQQSAVAQPGQYPTPEPAPQAAWSPEVGAPPTAEDFARRRQVRPADPVATMGVRAVANRIGLRLPPGRHEQEVRRDIDMVRRNFGGLRQVTVVNPKGGAGKTVAILLLAMTFGQKRGGYVLAWDNNETQGTLGMRAQQDFHARTVRDLLRDLGQFHGSHGRVGDLSQYVRSQGEGMFDVLASDESATGGEMLTAAAFAEIREVVSRFYKLIFVDTGNNVRAQNWQAAMDATDQLVVTMSARNDSAETAARMLDHLEQSGRQRLVRQAVTVVSMPPSRKEIDLPAIQEHFSARTRAVLLAPYERLIDTGEPIRYGALSSATRDAWLKIAAAVAEGL
ncbi:chromosome partitioning protein [Micromonospora thermarum]|uniref:Chromosome partitioning protein n=1 Tax=Micromonospora thermarum TaxID=2720024 RepID=A0ABX0Z9V8_9ACTN|nr:chromosome partitioning protein [Micromonospora thermarum]NJP34258.1 chromosome partitioning protein [Micromonospora thermarum]